MRVSTLILGILCLFVVLFDAFQTIILPRRAIGRFRITSIFYILTWRPWIAMARFVRHPGKRESVLSYYGPLSLILLLMIWAGGLVLGFGLLFSSLGRPFHDNLEPGDIRTDIYVSGTTLFTLGLGDVVPQTPAARVLTILEAGTGLGFLAVVMGYFPVLYGAFSRREVSIALLDARAGSPPTAAELLRRHSHEGADESLALLLNEWERWSAELLESHISYPLLCYFRSQHTNQSWLSALTAILDTSALLIAGVRGQEARQAQLTFAMARHALVDLAQIFFVGPRAGAADRLPLERYDELYGLLCKSGVAMCRDGKSFDRLKELRELYEGHAEALAAYLHMPLPAWMPNSSRLDNWERVARIRAQSESLDPAVSTENAELAEPHHDF
jgi:Ion channel